MNTFRRVFLPALVIVVLLAALVFRLSSCASDASKSASPAENTQSPSASASETPASPGTGTKRPTPPYSGVEIRALVCLWPRSVTPAT